MDMVPLQAAARPKEKARKLRRSGAVPCILYGNGTESVSLQCEERPLQRAYQKAGESTLVDLVFGEQHFPVLFHAVDFDPVSDRIRHVDFYAVDLTKEIEAQVPVHFEGEVPALKQSEGVFVTVLNHVTVRCLPASLPPALTVSVEKLQALHDTLTVGDIPLPAGVAVKEDPDQVIAIVQEVRKEEVIAAQPAEAAPAEGAAAGAPAEGAVPADKESAKGK